MAETEIDIKLEVPDRSRCMILRVGDDVILGWLLQTLTKPGFVIFPKIKGVPIGTALITVHYDYVRRTFDFILQHESFESCPRGRIFPELKFEYETVGVRTLEMERWIPVSQPPNNDRTVWVACERQHEPEDANFRCGRWQSENGEEILPLPTHWMEKPKVKMPEVP